MTRIAPFALALAVLAALAVSLAPTASAAAECDFTGPPVGGIVGRTYQYATNIADAACDETFAYASDVCLFVFGPTTLCYAL